MRNILRFWFGGFIGCSFIERSNLSPFGFILHYWTMMFLYTILESSSLRFQRAQEHRKRSPDDQDMFVFVLDFFLFFVGRPPGQPRPAPGPAGSVGRPA